MISVMGFVMTEETLTHIVELRFSLKSIFTVKESIKGIHQDRKPNVQMT